MATANSLGHFPRIRFRPRISVGAILGGLALGVGVMILLQQFSVTYPSLGVVLGYVLGGLVVGLLSGNLGRMLATRRFNAQLVALEQGAGGASAPGAVDASVAAEPAPAPHVVAAAVVAADDGHGWRATHVVTASDTPAWSSADSSGPPDVMLEEGVQLQLLDEDNGLVEVRAHTGWSGWVPLERLSAFRG